MKLHSFNEIHIDKHFDELNGDHENELFHNCKFDKINDLTLKNCVLNGSTFHTNNIRDLRKFCITLDCRSFSNVRLSKLIFDLILSLLVSTEGNDIKRMQLIDIIGKDRFEELKKEIGEIE